ncbi:hypothetical protein N7491_010793 [Penicillium cf. griseofulvum]|uniref:Ribosomal RNA methyltransferase FtsJ domain-containing protein n=1 Tax=Penicillium cf. griseofulvum TaxID=2972120 RepID=A0A9W9T652_9EURO|nr:hypothetical protein N7472_001117 [Penicillium cf. griseofulvum]KAJ5422348.1 hypothetical protein N7491_010793 [Penicillium cf. griseofulvum]KAJ5428531.1 hypothetical protein N7445_009985 [Penicillium cf. griseofulvum]
MTKQVGKGMAFETSIFKLDSPSSSMLDLCMAPGGFTATAATELPRPLIDAVTLPVKIGGYEVMAKNICQNIIYADITMYPTEMACQEDIPTAHPDSSIFELCQPFLYNRYDIAICGGAVGRDHPRESYRSNCEAQRLMVSQLVFAMHRLKPGGSIVLLLHRVESWETVCILHAFNQFSDIQLYKHPKAHAIKSSFYLVAKKVNLEHHAARESMKYWKNLWKYLTFKEFEEVPFARSDLYRSDDAFVETIRDSFGPQFLRLAEPIWKVQAEALRNAPFMRHA